MAAGTKHGASGPVPVDVGAPPRQSKARAEKADEIKAREAEAEKANANWFSLISASEKQKEILERLRVVRAATEAPSNCGR